MEIAHSKYNKMDGERGHKRRVQTERGAGGGCLSGKKGCVVPFAFRNTGSHSEAGEEP